VKYHKRFGHCRVPQNWKENNSLAHWVKAQRMDYANGELHGDRIVLLEKIGFEWRVDRSTWEQRFTDLGAYKERFGNTRVPKKWAENHLLASWVIRQRHLHRKKRLGTDLIERLDAIGFEWDGRVDRPAHTRASANLDRQWRTMFDQFKSYAELNGVESVRVVDAETKKLNRWMLCQRQAMKKGEMGEARIAALNEIGFVWQRNNVTSNSHSLATLVAEEPIVRTWDEMFADLVDFYKLHGHFNVPENWPPQLHLARWSAAQRRAKKQNRLRSEQMSRLEEVGFPWNTNDGGWDSMFAKLADYMRPMHNGKRREVSASDELQRWILTQRQAKKRGDLDATREKKLTSIGFEWDPFSSRWETMMEELRQFLSTHGHCRVPAGWSKNPALANWVGVQRARKLKGKLSAERIEALNSLGFAWRLGEFRGTRSSKEAWEKMLRRLIAFHAHQGHSAVPQIYPEDQKLGWWVTSQRRNRRKGKLTPSQIESLDRLGFNWSPLGATAVDDRWEHMFEALKMFSDEFGHCRVPSGWPENPQLANWVGVQRRQFRLTKLSDSRKAALESIGFEWALIAREERNLMSQGVTAFEIRWQQLFAELAAYQMEHGHCRVPSGWTHNAQLANWVGVQRRRYKQGKLSDERVRQLQSLGFDWSVEPFTPGGAESATEEAQWAAMLERLRAYQAMRGNCLVPQRWKEDVRLADWVSDHRAAYHQGLLSPDRISSLEALGFDWDPISTRWDEMYQKLVEFKNEHGHTNVPQRTPKYTELATWVRNQRAAKTHNRPIMAERAKLLDEIGFTWRLVEQEAWQRMLERLIEFKQVHGHCNVPQKGGVDKRLGKWVNTQRTHFKQGRLKPDRMQKLEAVGFIWNAKPARGGTD
jgi:hypothetical protein